MLKKLSLAMAVALMTTAPVWAQDMCGDEPIPPAIPSAADVGQKSPADAQKMKHGAFVDIRNWQASLKNYRQCLDSTVDKATRDLQTAKQATKPDQDKLKSLQGQIDSANRANQRSTDTEERIVNDFNALSTAYCSRPDVDKASCPKS